MKFNVRALSADNVIGDYTMMAADRADLERQLAERALKPVSVREQLVLNLPGLPRRQQRFDLLLFSQELRALLKAGLGLLESIEALADKEPMEITRDVLSRLAEQLRGGNRFSSALSAQPESFPPIFVGLLRTAEGTSTLPQALARYIDFQERVTLIRNKVVSASVYPAILVVVGAAVTLFLMIYVVPRFASVYEGTGRNLPWLSQLLIDWGTFASRHTFLLIGSLLGATALLAVVVWSWMRSGAAARTFHSLPVLGEHIRLYSLSRLYMTLGLLLDNGLPITEAMSIARNVLSIPLRKALDRARDAVLAGNNVSVSMHAEGLSTPISMRLMKVGEQSGELGAMLVQAAQFYDGTITRFVDRFTRAFEPALMALIGIVIGLIVVLMYMPIFDLAGSLQ